jgi:hypothetical protein
MSPLNIDGELRRALRREEPPPGFAERVLARLNRTAPRRWMALGIAASLLIAIGAIKFEQERRTVRQAERARRDVEIALRIASEKLSEVQMRIADIGARRGAAR